MTPEDAQYLGILGLCERFGWKLEYAERLDPIERAKITTMLNARDRALNWRSQHQGGGEDGD